MKHAEKRRLGIGLIVEADCTGSLLDVRAGTVQ